LHFEVVDVSSANQYKTKPLELVSTFVPLIVTVIRVELEAGVTVAVLLLAAAGLLLLETDEPHELTHAAPTKATAASPAASRSFRILSHSLHHAASRRTTGAGHP
jgi:hypothetical protein